MVDSMLESTPPSPSGPAAPPESSRPARRRGWLACFVAGLALLAGCTAGPGSADDAGVPLESADCPGERRPELADCARGASWADCGGTGSTPRFGCTSMACWWFAGGCVAEGLSISTCPADDLCCRPSGSEGFPFDSSSPGEFGVTELLTGWGREPWDRTRARNVDARVAPLAAIEEVEVTCAPESFDGLERGPCACPAPGLRRWDGDVLELRATPSCSGILFWYLSVEVTRDADGSLHARVCRIQTTDVAITSCPPRDREPQCAIDGTLILEAFPTSAEDAEGVRVDLSVIFSDGVTIDARL